MDKPGLWVFVLAERSFPGNGVTEKSNWDCDICFNSTPIWSAAAQPSQAGSPSLVSYSTYLLLLEMATWMIEISHLEQPDVFLFFFFKRRVYNGLRNYSCIL